MNNWFLLFVLFVWSPTIATVVLYLIAVICFLLVPPLRLAAWVMCWWYSLSKPFENLANTAEEIGSSIYEFLTEEQV